LSTGILTLLLFSVLIIFLLTGLPLSFCLSGAAAIFLTWQMGIQSLYLVVSSAYTNWTNFILVAVPLFVLMANFLQESGISEDLYEAMYKWMGGLRGGLAMGTVAVSSIFAAMSGISGVATVTMGLIALPSMLKRSYDKSIAIGCIASGGALGILIPPSVVMILYASITGESVGQLFMGGILPGCLLALNTMGYIAVRCLFNPDLGPPLGKEARASWSEKLKSLKAIIFPALLIILVLGLLYLGITTPTEASAVGAMGAFLCLILKRRLSWKVLEVSLLKTLELSCMIMWIILGAKLFSHIYYGIGAPDFIMSLISSLQVNRWIILIIMQIIMIFLGMFIDPMGIIVICTPVFVPIVQDFGFNTIWFAVLFTINMEVGYITPPFGFNLFYLKGVVPKEITMRDIYRAILPFALLDMFSLGIIMAIPEIVLWIPNTMIP